MEEIYKKKILLVLDKNQIVPFDYSVTTDNALSSMGGNSGNNVFQYSLQRLLTNDKNIVTIDTKFLHKNLQLNQEYFNWINDNFDCLVFSPANVLALYAKDTNLKIWTERLNKISIPIFAIGMGAQSDNKFSLNFLNNIKNEATNFVKAIRKNNGYIGTRGYFTSRCLAELGFKENIDFEPIGCPSMFMFGDDVCIQKANISEDKFFPIFNGFRIFNSVVFQKYFDKYKKSFFVDQEEFYNLLYNQEHLLDKDVKYLHIYANRFLNLQKDNRIKLYGTFETWYTDLKYSNAHFSFGCRIHGNIVPLLAGIPAYIDAFDSRVKELAQYFEIPFKEYNNEEFKFDDPYELYMNCDYTSFNRNFKHKYKKYEQFMNKCNLNIHPISRNIDNQDKIPFKVFPLNSSAKKVMFVAHEFGLYRGHGGIASYLYNITKWLLNNTNYEVHILADNYDCNCELLNNPSLFFHELKGNLERKRKCVFDIVSEVSPDYVEFADFLALGLNCMKARAVSSNAFLNSIFVVNCHTATRECWEWSTGQEIIFAPYSLIETVKNEYFQLKYADHCICPSSFLANYVTKHYKLQEDVKVFANPYLLPLEKKEAVRNKICKIKDVENYNDSFNIILITRFEGRKHQDLLLKAFSQLKKEGLNIRLFLAGNTSVCDDCNDYRYKVYSTLPKNGTKGVYIFDFLTLEQQEDLIAIADLTIMPSTYENQPVAMAEMVLRGIPVMGSVHSGIKDYTLDDCLLFDPFDEQDLTNKIRNFIKLSKELKDEVVKNQYLNLQNFIDPKKSILPRFYLTRRIEHNAN